MSRASYKLTSHRPGSDSTLCEGSVAADYNKGVNAFSVVLRHNAAGTLVCMGADKASCTISLASGTQMISSPEIESATGCAILRDDTRISYRRPHETAPFADLEELKDYMRRSTDIHEGFWTYLDRDMDHRRASLGGNYTLATVASESGYDIVYINGSDSKGWKSLMIKGHMHSTLFMHHFDLEWKDINGSTAGNEASASVSDGAILSLSFPLLKTTVRFRKVPVKDL